MPSKLAALTPRLLLAWSLHRAQEWVGEDALQALDAALSQRGETGPIARLQAWLHAPATAQQLLQAAQAAEAYVQAHCPDPIRQFTQMGFADLPAVQAALHDLPAAMDADAVRAALREAIQRDFSHLSDAQVQQAVACYTDALQRALLAFEDFALPVIGQAVLDLRASQDAAFAHIQTQLDAILAKLPSWKSAPTLTTEEAAALETAIFRQQVLVQGDVSHSVIIIGRGNTVALQGEQLQQAREIITLPGDLPPGAFLPVPRNAYFTGRAEALETLVEVLISPPPPAASAATPSPSPTQERGTGGRGAVLVTGMGGVGKTQLVVEFAWRYGYRFKGVHWLDLHDPDLLDEAIARNGQAMGLFSGEVQDLPLPDRVRLTLRAWQADGPRLLILDNLEALDRAPAILSRLRHASLRLLITSRRRDWPPTLGLHPLPLDEFTPEESRAFLRRWLPPRRATDADLDALAERLGRLPLALELAARYLHHLKRKTVAAYLDDLTTALDHRSMRGWKPEWGSPTGHSLNLAQTFALSWEAVHNPTARRLFVAAGYCAPNEPLPREALAALVESEDADALEEALADLTALGLLKDPPAIHPLLAEFARQQDADRALLRALAEALADLAARANRKADCTGNYSLFTPLLPHGRAVAARAEREAPEGAARLWNSLGCHLCAVADYAAAKAAHARALHIDEAVFGPDHPNVARNVNNLGLVLQALGDLQGAKAAFERALRIDEAAFGPDHPNVAIRVNNLGSVLRALGDQQGAKAAFERALRIDEAVFGLDHPNVARNVNNLGMVLQALGDLQGAKAAFERALRIDEATFGPDHPHVAIRVNNLGNVLRALGDQQGAKAAFERALRIDEAVFGPDHPQVATAVNNLGGVLQALGDQQGAKAAFERALRIDEAAFGPDHPNVAIRVNNLGSVLRALGDQQGAKAAFERALRIDEAAFGPDHPKVAIRVNNLGLVLQALGDLAGAKAAYERALRIDEAAFGPDHPKVAIRVNNLGEALRALGDLPGAKAACERALRIFEKFLPLDHPHIRIVRDNLAALQRQRNTPDAAP